MKIRGRKRLIGEIKIPGDKSISHRAIILGSISEGVTNIENILLSEDTVNTINIFKELGVDIDNQEPNKVSVRGNGIRGLREPNKRLDCGNSGTTMRLVSGVLIGQRFPTILFGDESLSKRPMKRIISPLSLMGASISGSDDNYSPINITPSKQINVIDYTLPIASAQVKSSILLASLYTEGTTVIRENKVSRDHTERMLDYFGANLEYSKDFTKIENPNKLIAKDIIVPGDISSASYFIVAASIIEGSSIILKDVGINPTRIGIVNVLVKMGADINMENIREVNNELMADIKVTSRPLHGITIQGDIIGTLIDEIPILAVAATFAEGDTIIKDAEELKNKETDRIIAISDELNKMGANIEPRLDGLVIHSCSKLKATTVDSHNDHRIAMALSIAALNSEGTTEITNSECIDISYPNYYKDLGKLIDYLFDLN